MNRIHSILIAISMALVALSGCSDDATTQAKSCTVDTECKGDRVCVSGVCQSPDGEDPADMQQTSDMGDDVLQPPRLDVGQQPDLVSTDMELDLSCADGYVYNAITGQCVPQMCEEEGDCAIEQYCDTQTMTCTELTCTTLEIDCPGDRPHIDPETCLCVGCVGDSDCADREVCESGTCTELACQGTCDPTDATSCGSEQYCNRGCCTDCIGSADCGLGEICSLGACVASPDCSQDPSICPSGTTCINGACLTDGAPTCDTGCPVDSYCGSNGNCIAKSDPDCGQCNSDCSCPNGLECKGTEMGAFCYGCSSTDPSKACPMNQFCLDESMSPLDESVCFAGSG